MTDFDVVFVIKISNFIGTHMQILQLIFRESQSQTPNHLSYGTNNKNITCFLPWESDARSELLCDYIQPHNICAKFIIIPP